MYFDVWREHFAHAYAVDPETAVFQQELLQEQHFKATHRGMYFFLYIKKKKEKI